MPFPMAHGVVGISLSALCRPGRSVIEDWKFLMLSAVLAISPDLDFFFVWVWHLSKRWHRGFTHSIGFALLAVMVGLAITRGAYIKQVLTCGLAILSHGILDFATTRADGGVELLWPVLRNRYRLGLFGLSESGWTYHTWLDPIRDSLRMSVVELAVFGPLLIFVLIIRQPVYRVWRRFYGEPV